jgi:Type IV secretion-system coupling protein DNA-binding domain
MSNSTQTVSPSTGSSPPQSIDFMPWLLILAVPMLFFYVLKGPNWGRKPKIGLARMATPGEVKKSKAKAVADINDPHGMTLWIGMPKKFSVSPSGQRIIVPDRHTVMLPKINEHCMVYGGSGAGKSRYILNRIGFAAAMNGDPIIAVEAKGDEEQYQGKRIAATSEIAGFAIEQGYEVFVVGPWFPDSHCLNIIQLLKDANDSGTAGQLSDTATENGLGDGDRPDIWSKAGSTLLSGVFMMCRGLKQGGDLATAQRLLARLAEDPLCIKGADITPYQRATFDQFYASARSPETAASVAFSALGALGRAMVPEITAVFCGATNIPIILKKKQMLIFRLDPRYKSVIMPWMAAALEVILTLNVYSGRPHGGLALLDELPQYRLPQLAENMGVARSKQWAFVLGAQGETILEAKYGETRTKAILENVQSLFIMRLASNQTAKNYAESLGQEDTRIRNRTESHSGESTAHVDQQRSLVPLQELQQQPTGRCVAYLPGVEAVMEGGIKGEKRIRIPIRHQFLIPKRELKAMVQAVKVWREYRKLLVAKSTAKPLTERQLQAREVLALNLLPESKQPASPGNSGNVNTKEVQEANAKLTALFSATNS